VAIVDALDGGNGRSDGHWRGVGSGTQAETEQQLLVFAIQVQDLENLRLGFLDVFFARGIGSTRG
jgi:hypothetical protein